MSNPAINKLDEYSRLENDSNGVMSISGTITSFALLSLLLLLPAAITWNWAALGFFDRVTIFGWIGVIAGLILALIISFVPKTAPFLAPLYAVCEGAFLGGLSALFEMQFKGIVIQAVAATFAVTFVMAVLYKTNVIRVTEKFRSTIIAVTGAIALLYIVNLIMVLCGFNQISNFLWSNSPLSIGFSIIVCAVAAFNLLLDFDIIERFSQYNAPKYMDWYCGFALMVTLVWLYLEILRLLSKFSRR